MMIKLPLLLIDVIVTLYTYVTLPIYYVIEKPWIQVAKSTKKRLICDPVSPDAWIRNTDFTNDYHRDTPPLAGCKTLSQLVSLAFSLFRDRNCLGFRAVLETQDCEDAAGRIYQKKRLQDEYTWLTFDDVDKRVDNIVAGLLMSGIKPGQSVALIMDGCVEWTLCAFAVTRMGAVLVTVFPAISSQGINDVLEECSTTAIITDVTTAKHKIDKASLSKLKCIKLLTLVASDDQFNQTLSETYHFNGEKPCNLSIVTLDQLEKKGSDALDTLAAQQSHHLLLQPNVNNNNNNHVNDKHEETNQVQSSLAETLSYPQPRPTDKALIMYSSGTTGKPKGVVYLQGHFVHTYQIGVDTIISDRLGPQHTPEIYLSFLPPSHIFEFTIQFCFIASGASIGFGSPFTAFPKGIRLLPGCLPDVQVLNPTFVIVVPLLLERMRTSIEQQLSLKSPLLRSIVKSAIDYRLHWKTRGYSSPLIEKLLLRKTTHMLFGNRITKIITGSAPLSSDTQRFLSGLLTANLRQGYGMTEAFAFVTVCDGSDWSLGTVGSVHPGIKIKLRDWPDGSYYSTDKPFPRGELLIGGKHVSTGYYNRPEETEENFFFDKQSFRWYVTGDIVEVNTINGTLRIIDRKKDLVKMANGEFISLGKIESALRLNRYVENIYIHATANDCIAFILPNVDMITSLAEGELRDAKDTEIKKTPSLQAICTDSRVRQRVIDSLNETARKANLSSIETPKQIYLEYNTWTPENGLVTATLKVRRKQLQLYYQKTIAELTSCTK